MGVKLIDVLLVEDNPDHAELIIKEIDNKAGIFNKIHLVRDGQEALDYLLRKGDYCDPLNSPVPGLILLDLKLPKIDGVEVLQTIRSHERLQNVPVIVLTTSSHEEDIIKSYESGTNYYITKPVKYENLLKIFEKFGLL